jgi:hypothetical protein
MIRKSLVLLLALSAMLLAGTSGFAADPANSPATSGTVAESPDATCPPDGQCFADVPASNPFYSFINRIFQQDLVSGYPCGGFGEPCDSEGRPYYRPVNNVTRQQMAKFIDNARRLSEIHINVISGTAPIYARNDTGGAIGAYSTSGQALTAISESQLAIYAQTGASTAVYGTASGAGSIGIQGNGAVGVKGNGSSSGIEGNSTDGAGVDGHSTNSWGVYGFSGSYIGVYGLSACPNCRGVEGFSSSGYGVYGYSATGQAGHFQGNVQVTGNLSKGGGSFKIDHPLDPADKYLYHSFVESPDMMNVYNGNVTTDAKGEAIVQLPDYFEALNKDFRYQLTIMGDQFAQARVSSKIKDNHFTIMTDKPTIEVSWQVTGIRQDPYANAHRIPVEEDKPQDERGKYLHPTEWGQPASLGVDYERQQSLIADQQESGQDNR